MLFALRAAQDPAERMEIVAVTHECDYPPAATTLPQLTRTVIPEGLSAAEIDAEVKRVTGEGRALYELDEDALRAAAPDLIVTQALCEVCAVSHGEVVRAAQRLPAKPTVLSQDPTNLTGMLDDILRLGTATGTPGAAMALRQGLEARLAAVEAAVADRPRPRTLALEWLDPPFIGGHWVPQMIEIAGGEDVMGHPGARSTEVTWEELGDLDPDVVVAMPCGFYVENSRAQVIQNRGRVKALGGGDVFAVDAASSFSRPGPRLIEGVELLASLLHPGAVEAPQGVGSVSVSV